MIFFNHGYILPNVHFYNLISNIKHEVIPYIDKCKYVNKKMKIIYDLCYTMLYEYNNHLSSSYKIPNPSFMLTNYIEMRRKLLEYNSEISYI